MTGQALQHRDIANAKLCAFCGITFFRDKRCTWKHWERAKFCSRDCSGKYGGSKWDERRLPMAEDFARWFDKPDGCWEWRGAVDKDGYGAYSYRGKTRRAAIVALELDGRKPEAGQYACHHCDNPPCVRPDHLYPGTPKQNFQDMKDRQRFRPSSKLTTDQVLSIRSTDDDRAALAGRFNCSAANIDAIRARRTWRHL